MVADARNAALWAGGAHLAEHSESSWVVGLLAAPAAHALLGHLSGSWLLVWMQVLFGWNRCCAVREFLLSSRSKNCLVSLMPVAHYRSDLPFRYKIRQIRDKIHQVSRLSLYFDSLTPVSHNCRHPNRQFQTVLIVQAFSGQGGPGVPIMSLVYTNLAICNYKEFRG